MLCSLRGQWLSVDGIFYSSGLHGTDLWFLLELAQARSVAQEQV